jgi:peroxidase
MLTLLLPELAVDGRNNNKRWPEWGATKTRRVRKFPNVAGFLEGTNDTPLDENNTPGLPSARRIMEELFRKVPPKPDKDSSAILLAMGEFIAQDIVMFSTNDTESFDVPCDGELNDLVYCPGTGQQYNITESIPFHRLVSGTRNGVRATINEQTAYLDLSNVYGISEEDANRRRAAGGKMALDEEGLFPEDKIAWVSGNKSPSSYALMVVFARYHNLIASNWADRDPSLSDDDIFHIARRRTIAVYQQLVEEKYLPFVVGDRLNAYSGYDESVDPAIDEFFAAVAFRYGHSSLPSVVRMLDEKFDPMPSSPLLLRDIFAQPPPNHVQALVKRYGGVEPFLRGLVTVPSKAIDLSFADDLNIYTSATAVKDIQRGRDVGIPRYNDVREAMGRGRSRLQSMEELANGNPVALEALRSLYDDNVNLVDAYVGALLEDTSSYLNPLAPTLTWSIKDQFERIRDGDRYWYKNLYTAEEYSEFPSFSGLIRLVCSDMELFPDEPFSVFYPGVSLSDDDASCSAASQNLNQLSLLG